MPIDRRQFLLSTAVAAAAPAPRTNVVLIMTDDHGAWSLGCYGNAEGHTPNIDRLAAGGVRFTNAFAAAAVCSPSRMTFMTGKIPSQHGVQDYILGDESDGPASKRFLDGHTIYPEILARHDYALGYCGKWHMGDDAVPQKGFTHWFTTPGGPFKDPRIYRNGRVERVPGYKTDVVAGSALQFLDANRDRPFFLQIADNAPHTPYDYQPDEYRKPYLDSKFPAFPDGPAHPNQIEVYKRYLGQRESKLSYMALVRGVDQNVGRILRRIDELGLRERTLVIFCADQGFNCGHHGVWGKGNGTLPFNMYEETLRIPMIWSQPGRIRGGRTLDPLVSSYDFFPTLLDYLGLPPHRDSALAGRSFNGFLGGRAPRWDKRVFAEYAYARMIRSERFKYVQRAGGRAAEFYDLEADPGERRNLIAEPGQRSQVARFKDELATWFAARGAPPIEEWRSTARNRLDAETYTR